jgi:HDOD domain
MNASGQTRPSAETPFSYPEFGYQQSLEHTCEPHYYLPILPRSASFLRELLQNSIIDLELASAVISLDPGLTYGVLQQANRQLSDDKGRIWQLPLAVLNVGRSGLEALLESSSVVGASSGVGDDPIHKLVVDAVVRASVAHFIARDQGIAAPRKSFLCGLLFDLPTLIALGIPRRSRSTAALLRNMCHSLPAALVRAAFARSMHSGGAPNAILSAVLLSQEIVEFTSRADTTPDAESSREIHWPIWQSVSLPQRAQKRAACISLGLWARANVSGIEPWHFMSRLDRKIPWE